MHGVLGWHVGPEQREGVLKARTGLVLVAACRGQHAQIDDRRRELGMVLAEELALDGERLAPERLGVVESPAAVLHRAEVVGVDRDLVVTWSQQRRERLQRAAKQRLGLIQTTQRIEDRAQRRGIRSALGPSLRRT
jgi:hypothetical protein